MSGAPRPILDSILFQEEPLVVFTSNRDVTGDLVNRRFLTALSWFVALVIITLNIYYLLQTLLLVR